MDLFNKKPPIDGLQYIPNFVSKAEAEKLLAEIDAQEWLTDLKRRVQHYGWKYDYKSRRVSDDLRIGALPDWLAQYAQKLLAQCFFETTPDQAIVNEYMAGQGISAHSDSLAFGGVVASLSLGSGCVMDFSNGERKELLYLEPQSLVVLSGDARYQWQHAIAARKSDKICGVNVKRGRRVSVTFRTVL